MALSTDLATLCIFGLLGYFNTFAGGISFPLVIYRRLFAKSQIFDISSHSRFLFRN